MKRETYDIKHHLKAINSPEVICLADINETKPGAFFAFYDLLFISKKIAGNVELISLKFFLKFVGIESRFEAFIVYTFGNMCFFNLEK